MNKSFIGVATLFTIALMAAASSASIIKIGDVLDVRVVGHTEFSGRYPVRENGTIDHPLLADVPVANTSTSELMNDLTLRLARHIDNPLVLIAVVQKPEISVTVLGLVAKPGPVLVGQGATIQEVIQAAGGAIQEAADLEHVKVVHKTRQPQTETCNLRNFLIDADLDKLPVIEANDIVVVPAQQKTKKVKVIGAVMKPGLFTLEEKTTLFEIIYLAGGPAEKADLSRVRRVSQGGAKSTEEVIDVQSFIDRGKMDDIPAVAEGDVIIVYTKWFDWKTVLTVVNNTLLVLVAIQTFGGVFKK